MLRERAVRDPHGPAVTFVSEFDEIRCSVRTREELDLFSRRIASWLQERLLPGDRVLLLHPPGVEFATAFSACVYAGLIAVPAPMPGRYRHERRRLASIARDAGVRAVLTQESVLPDVEKWLAEEGVVGAVVHATDTGEGDPEAWIAPAVSAQTLALLQYTSGSTGTPKGVMVSHGNLALNAEWVERAYGLGPEARWGSWIPLYHDMGLIGMMLPGLLRGRGYVQMDPMSFLRRPYNWLRMLDALDVHGTAAPDFAYDLCVRRVTDEQLATLDLSRLAGMGDGSEPVRADTVSRFCERFAAAGFRPEQFLPMYGLAEATLLVSGTHGRPTVVTEADVPALEEGLLRTAEDGAATRTLTGCGPSTGSEVLIVDPDSRRTLPDGRIGEIWLGGPCVTAGYWNNTEATDAAFRACTADGRGPFLRTGDLGGRRDGDLYITGRRKDVLVLHGRNLYPQDIEDELRAQHEELEGLHGAVFMVGDADGVDHTPSAVVVHEIRAHWGAERLGEIAVAMKQTVAREFGVPVGAVALVRPAGVRRTTSGKVQRSAMRAQYVGGELRTLHLSEDPLLTSALLTHRRVSA
ncbi:AMP-binding protein [Streptomyces sp. NPDC012510]|uniref:fatty acyl-AMP ligase n=1 Tax=Streptomyces sp. NPDC012510 TaxID=3364838 RepID=UPI0036E9CA38